MARPGLEGSVSTLQMGRGHLVCPPLLGLVWLL